MHPLGAGGCDFPVDPDQPATTEQLFWLATVSPDIIAMLALPSDLSDRLPVPLDRIDASRSDFDGTHLSIDSVHQLVSLDGTMTAPVGVLLPFDDWLPARLEATLALWRTLQSQHAVEPRPPTPQRRARLILGLRALDGRDDGASYRELARGLFGASRVPDGPAWKTHDLRSRVMRLVVDANALRDGGYLTLLQPSRRSRH